MTLESASLSDLRVIKQLPRIPLDNSVKPVFPTFCRKSRNADGYFPVNDFIIWSMRHGPTLAKISPAKLTGNTGKQDARLTSLSSIDLRLLCLLNNRKTGYRIDSHEFTTLPTSTRPLQRNCPLWVDLPDGDTDQSDHDPLIHSC